MPDAVYVPVPVSAAVEVAERYAKAIVVVTCWDHAHDRVHTTTYAAHPAHKAIAAEWGERSAAAIGCDLDKARSFEDFRYRTEAEAAAAIRSLRAERDGLLARVAELEAARG